MTVASDINRKTYTGDGVTTSFATSPLAFFATSDLLVYVTTTATGVTVLKTEGTHYTVSGGDVSIGAVGTVNTAGGSSPHGALLTGTTLVVIRELPLLQGADFVQNDASNANVAEAALDKLVMNAQRVSERVDRSLVVSDGDVSGADFTVPTPVGSRVFGWNSAGTALQLYSAADIDKALVSVFGATLIDDANAAAARATLDVPSNAEAILDTLIDAAGDLIVGTAADTAARKAVGAAGTVLMSRAAATDKLAYVAALDKAIYGLTYDNGTDATNDLNINVGGAMDATGTYWMRLATALGKQSDVAWAVGGTTGTPLGGLDTGAVGNSDYYIWLIARSDTGVVDAIFSLSSTAPTMPTNYDFKRLIGWFKRVAGTVVGFKTYETEGGGIELLWNSPTLDVNLVNTLTTSRRTDVVKVPTAFSVIANLNIQIDDGSGTTAVYIYCPDAADMSPSSTAAPLSTLWQTVVGQSHVANRRVRTSAAGLIAARGSVATHDNYRVATLGFEWARRN